MKHSVCWQFAQALMASTIMALLLLSQAEILELPATPGTPDQSQQLCASKCSTCPIICSAPPPPANAKSNSHQSPQEPPKGSSSAQPSTPANAAPSDGGQKGATSTNPFYYIYTSGGTRRCHLRHGTLVLLSVGMSYMCLRLL